ncbi:hypothetical protein [Thiocapsa sp.]|uniref:hypothetical protein n=1 Tax=Thiocapsa sp. TaxID=2024551 RepID=UPI0025DC0D85|nr:hypothetical protein [Thiocapsa sp.]
MRISTTQASIKLIGANGQIALGKQFAERQVLVEKEPGVWPIRTVTVIPDNELLVHHPQAFADIENALAWAEADAPDHTNLDAVVSEIRNAS